MIKIALALVTVLVAGTNALSLATSAQLQVSASMLNFYRIPPCWLKSQIVKKTSKHQNQPHSLLPFVTEILFVTNAVKVDAELWNL